MFAKCSEFADVHIKTRRNMCKKFQGAQQARLTDNFRHVLLEAERGNLIAIVDYENHC